ncbi:hypothetical protein K220099C10_26390 [Bacteroides thetaiotaomicron]
MLLRYRPYITQAPPIILKQVASTFPLASGLSSPYNISDRQNNTQNTIIINITTTYLNALDAKIRFQLFLLFIIIKIKFRANINIIKQ